MRLEQNGTNPLKELISILPEELETLTPQNMRRYADALIPGGVICETIHEVYDALKILAELEVLELITNTDGTHSLKGKLNVS